MIFELYLYYLLMLLVCFFLLIKPAKYSYQWRQQRHLTIIVCCLPDAWVCRAQNEEKERGQPRARFFSNVTWKVLT